MGADQVPSARGAGASPDRTPSWRRPRRPLRQSVEQPCPCKRLTVPSASHAVSPSWGTATRLCCFFWLAHRARLPSPSCRHEAPFMPVRIFLSTVSDEFLAYREQLRHDLTRPNVEVKIQEDFKDVAGTGTLDNLD